MGARLEGGAIHDEVVVPGVGVVPVEFRRCTAGWQVTMELPDPVAAGATVVHRLVSPSRREAKAAVPLAAAFLLDVAGERPVVTQ